MKKSKMMAACRPGSTYIITGGLGGFGLALAQWLVPRGAACLLLTSSRGVRTGSQRMAIRALEAAGTRVSQPS